MASFSVNDKCCLIGVLANLLLLPSTRYKLQPDLIREFKVSPVNNTYEPNVCFGVCLSHILQRPEATIPQEISICICIYHGLMLMLLVFVPCSLGTLAECCSDIIQ